MVHIFIESVHVSIYLLHLCVLNSVVEKYLVYIYIHVCILLKYLCVPLLCALPMSLLI